ncbi:unnamed protein product [Closterium sp. NIES-53]
MSALGQVATPCSCRLLLHQTLLWQHRQDHPSLLRHRGMHSHLLVSGLPRSLPPLPPSPAPPCLPCVEGRQRAAPHYSSFPPTTAPLQTLHLDVAFVRDTSADKLSARAIPSVFLGFSPDAPGWQFYHPTSRKVFPSQDVTSPSGRPLLPKGPAPSGVSQVDPLLGTAPFEVAVGSSAARGAASGGAASRGAEPGVAEPGGAEPGGAKSEGAGSGNAESGGEESEGAGSGGAEPWGAEPGGAEPAGVEPWDAESRGTASSGGPAGAPPRLSLRPEPLSPQQLRKWFSQRFRLSRGAIRAGDSAAGDSGAGGAGVTTGAGGTRGAAAAGPGGARTEGTGAAGTGSVGGAGPGDPTEPGAAGIGGVRAVGAGAGGTGAGVAGAGELELLTLELEALALEAQELEDLELLTEHREPASRPVSPVFSGRCVPRPRPPPDPGTHAMTLRPSSVSLCVPLLPPTKSSLPAIPDPESDRAHAASPNVSRLLATVVTDPSFESTTVSALVAELCALGTDVLQVKQEDFECLVAPVPRFASMLLAPEGDPDAPNIPTPHSYAKAITVPPSRANIVDGMWIFRVKRPLGSPPAFKERYGARGFSQQQRVNYVHTFSPTPKMTTLRELLHVAAQRDYELHSHDFSTAFLQGSLHKEIRLRRPPGFTGSFPAGTPWSLWWLVYGLCHATREWHDTLRTMLV